MHLMFIQIDGFTTEESENQNENGDVKWRINA